jgi:hypothetical protein
VKSVLFSQDLYIDPKDTQKVSEIFGPDYSISYLFLGPYELDLTLLLFIRQPSLDDKVDRFRRHWRQPLDNNSSWWQWRQSGRQLDINLRRWHWLARGLLSDHLWHN